MFEEARGDERRRGLEGMGERAAAGYEVLEDLLDDAHGADLEDVQRLADGDFKG